jgi:hypothetical protein
LPVSVKITSVSERVKHLFRNSDPGAFDTRSIDCASVIDDNVGDFLWHFYQSLVFFENHISIEMGETSGDAEIAVSASLFVSSLDKADHIFGTPGISLKPSPTPSLGGQ